MVLVMIRVVLLALVASSSSLMVILHTFVLVVYMGILLRFGLGEEEACCPLKIEIFSHVCIFSQKSGENILQMLSVGLAVVVKVEILVELSSRVPTLSIAMTDMACLHFGGNGIVPVDACGVVSRKQSIGLVGDGFGI